MNLGISSSLVHNISLARNVALEKNIAKTDELQCICILTIIYINYNIPCLLV